MENQEHVIRAAEVFEHRARQAENVIIKRPDQDRGISQSPNPGLHGQTPGSKLGRSFPINSGGGATSTESGTKHGCNEIAARVSGRGYPVSTRLTFVPLQSLASATPQAIEDW